MARITSAAVTFLLCLVHSPLLANAASSMTLIDSAGSISRTSIPQSSFGKGVVAVLTSPGTPSHFDSDSDSGVTLTSDEGGISIISSPGATLSSTSSLSKGYGAAAASAVSACVIVSGITESDLEYGLDETRHGATLTGIFRAGLAIVSDDNDSKSTLIIAVPVGLVDEMEESIISDVKAIFDTAKAELESDVEFDDLYNISIETVESSADAQRVIESASEIASQTELKTNISATIAEVYSKSGTTSPSTSSTSSSSISPSATAALLSCDDSFSRHYKAARAKLHSWKSRTGRNLVIDGFGNAAAQLRKRTMELYDRDTISASGVAGSVASYRLDVRSKLQERVDTAIRDLFAVQVDIVEKLTLKKFNAMLLRKHGQESVAGKEEQFYNDNDAALRSAAFAFDTAVSDLEVPSLSLTKAKAVQEMSNKLNTALLTFPDSPAARLKHMKKITGAVNKQKQPTERSIDFGLDLVAMIRPDGFGNLQGFGGYQLGGNNIIVGVHNDADSPDVIAQFGGKRPPFLRVQPKLKVDVEL